MKKSLKVIISVVAVVLLMTMLVACGNSSHKAVDATPEEPVKGESKVLVAYFSWSGNLQKMAGWVAEESGGELFRILPEEAYPSDYNDTADRAKSERDNDVKPALSTSIDAEVMANYDVILLGFPVWWYNLPMCVETFLTSYDFSGKTIIPFFSHEGSSNGASSMSRLKELCPESTVKNTSSDYLSIRGGNVASSEKAVKDWVKGLNLN
jgi:flavodoxin